MGENEHEILTQVLMCPCLVSCLLDKDYNATNVSVTHVKGCTKLRLITPWMAISRLIHACLIGNPSAFVHMCTLCPLSTKYVIQHCSADSHAHSSACYTENENTCSQTRMLLAMKSAADPADL